MRGERGRRTLAATFAMSMADLPPPITTTCFPCTSCNVQDAMAVSVRFRFVHFRMDDTAYLDIVLAQKLG